MSEDQDTPDAAPIETDRAALLLFDDLVDMPETRRTAWLRDQTLPPPVRARLEAMLKADRIASLGTGAAALAPGPNPLPERIGQYRILDLIGRGGMGAVYRATRDNDDFEHRVAIKLIKPGLLSDVLAARFRAERQTLANLVHPNIARLYDGGETQDASPFIVMELIEGQPIDRWADANALDTAARALLLETAALAVAYAHQRLIVHRDITPANVLVQADGTLKLIDFGIARPAAGAPESGADPARGPLAPTLIAATATATTATDIAALGRLLKRLIPAPPPEITAIINRATDSEEGRRTLTANALAADLAAWRQGWPVPAMNGGNRYRARKFVARNRGAVVFASLAMLLLVGGLVAVSLANAQARTARIAADARFAETRSLAKTMLFEIYDEVSRVPGATKARALLAKTGLDYLERLAAIPAPPAGLLAETGRGFVRLSQVIGGGQAQSLGRYADANALLARAETLIAPAYAANPQNRETALAFADLRLEQAGASLYNNNVALAARAQATGAERAARPFARSDAEAARIYGTALQALGDSHSWDDNFVAARPLLARAEAFYASLPPAIAADRRVRAARSANLRIFGETLHKLKEAPAARAVLDQSIALKRGLVADAPDDPKLRRRLAVSLWYAAVVHRTNQRDREAQAAIAEAAGWRSS